MANEKLLPRNQTARLASARAAGNPVTSDLESGVGNCYPGLELDLRNLERRFFPFLLVDFIENRIEVVGVDIVAARAALPAGALLDAYETLSADLRTARWRVRQISADFAGFGVSTFTVNTLRADTPDPSRPLDPWTAARLIVPGSDVSLVIRRSTTTGSPREVTVDGRRTSYLKEDGAFAEVFAPGELTQSLCSPWTHDFRDCGCYYWASNHPDIAQPALPPGRDTGDPGWTARTAWLRGERDTSQPVPANAFAAEEMAYFEISRRWQDLDIVLDGRESRAPYAPSTNNVTPLPAAQLVPALRYAAGVELGVMLEYVSAIFSVNPRAGGATSVLRGDVRSTRAELLRVAISEMRHLRMVNGILFSIHQSSGAAGPFQPALGIATLLPGGGNVAPRAVQFRPLDPATMTSFIAVEAPSLTVDGLYSRVLATLVAQNLEAEAAVVRSIMADGADHYQTFRAIEEWLGRHTPAQYLRTVTVPAPGSAVLQPLQTLYAALLGRLHAGYAAGMPAGAADVATARQTMLGATGIEGVSEALAAAGTLPVFAPPAGDARFAPVAPP